MLESPGSLRGRFARLGGSVFICAFACVLAVAPGASAQARRSPAPARAAATTGIHGAVTTQEGGVFLPGVVVTLMDASGAVVSETTSDGVGQYKFADLKPGTYSVRAVLDGFADALKPGLVVAAKQDVELNLDLEIAKLAESVEVKGGGAHQLPLEAAPSQNLAGGQMLEIGPIKGDNFEALLPTLPGILRSQDGHISIKGASPTQSSVQINAANVTDPSTGNLGFDLPNDAVESVDVLTNPYAAEYGRFSSGVTTLNTARGGPQWSLTPNGFIPRLFRSQSNWWDIKGIRSFRPRVALGGPLVADKAFLFENVLYRYFKTPIPGLTDEETPIFSEVKTFSRVDVNVSPTNQFNTTVATFPQQVDNANLNTFNRKDVSTNFRQGGFNATASNRTILGSTRFLESTVAVKRYDVRVLGHGDADMNVTPEANTGNYFNRQTRRSYTYQLVESLTINVRRAGEHLIKLGTDLLHVSYSGTSLSHPVNVLGEDGVRISRIEFGPTTSQHVASTEAALVAQDQWRLNDRVLLEVGGRMDRDGVLRRTNLTPRFGAVIGLQPEGRTVLRGGIGLFYDRTPLNVGAFESFESRTITEYAADGVTTAGAPVTLVNRSALDLKTPYGRTWNVELDHRVNDTLSFKVNHMRRNGFHEFIVNPVTTGATPELLLTSDGRSRYHETELSMRIAHADVFETTISYVRSHSTADLNSYDLFFGNARNPIVQPNQYGLTNVDAPNRLLLRGSYQLPWQIRFDPLLDVRNGFPYSAIAADQTYVGARNGAGRFPTFASFDFSASRPVKIWKYRATIGFRLFDALDRFNPRDVQQNIASPAFGTFYSTVPVDFQTFIELSFGKR